MEISVEMKYKVKNDLKAAKEEFKFALDRFVDYACTHDNFSFLQDIVDIVKGRSNWNDDEKATLHEVFSHLNNYVATLYLVQQVEYMDKEQQRIDAMETIGTVAQLIARPWEDALRDAQKVADKPNFLARIRTRLSKFIPNRFKKVRYGN